MSHRDRNEHPYKNRNSYRIRIDGHLPDRYSGWFEPLTVAISVGGITVLEGPVEDQAALHALLRNVRDLGLTLISVERYDPGLEQAEEGVE